MFDVAQIGEVPRTECAAFARLRHRLESAAFVPLNLAAWQAMSIGFIDPYADGPPLAVELPSGGFVAWVRIDERATNEKQVDALTRQRVASEAKATGAPLAPEAILEIRHRVCEQLAEVTQIKETVIPVLLGHPSGTLVIGSASKARRDDVLAHLSRCLESRIAWRDAFRGRALAGHLTAWLTAGEAPPPLTLGDCAVLTGVGTSKATVRVRKLSTAAQALRQAIDDGLQVEQLGLASERLEVVWDTAGILRGLRVTLAGERSLNEDIPEDLVDRLERACRVRWQAEALLKLIGELQAAVPIETAEPDKARTEAETEAA